MANPEYKFGQNKENKGKWWKIAALGVAGVIIFGALVSQLEPIPIPKIK